MPTRTRKTEQNRTVGRVHESKPSRPAGEPTVYDSALLGLKELGADEPVVPAVTLLLQELAHALHELRSEVRSQSRVQGPTLSIDDACEMLGCKERRLFYLLKEGSLEGAPRVGRERRISKASVERLLTARPKGRKRRARTAAEPARLESRSAYGNERIDR